MSILPDTPRRDAGDSTERVLRVASRLRGLRQRVQRDGFQATARHLAQRGAEAVHTTQTLEVLRRPLDEPLVEPRRGGRIRLEDLDEARLEDLRRLNLARGDTGSDARFAADLRTGYHCFVGYIGDTPIGHYWWADWRSDPPHYDLTDWDLHLTLHEGDVYGSNFYVLPEFRGDGIAAEFCHAVETAFRDRGYRQLWGYVLTENYRARWVYEGRGYQAPWMVVRTRTLGRWRSRVLPVDRPAPGTASIPTAASPARGAVE